MFKHKPNIVKRLSGVVTTGKNKIAEKTVAPIFEMVLAETLNAYERFEDKSKDFETFVRELLAESLKRKEK